MKFEFIKLSSLDIKSRAAAIVASFILFATAAVNAVSMSRSEVSVFYKAAGFAFQLLLAVILVYSVMLAAILHDRMGRPGRPGFVLITGAGLKTAVFLIALLGVVNAALAIYAIALGFTFSGCLRSFSYVILSPLPLFFLEGFVYSDQDYLFIGMRKLSVPLMEIAKIDIACRKLGVSYIISLTDSRGKRAKITANEMLKDRFIKFIGKYDAGITIYD
jgi:hypothetical protein